MSSEDLGGFEFDAIFDGDGEDLGGWMGLLFAGHIDDETAIAVTWSYMEEYGYGYALGTPKRCWVRKVPSGYGWSRFIYSDGPGRGASGCTRVERASSWRYWCDVPRCSRQFVPGSGTTGVPRQNITNGDELGVQDQHRPGEYVYLCRTHHRRYEDDLRVARREALERYYAEQAAS